MGASRGSKPVATLLQLLSEAYRSASTVGEKKCVVQDMSDQLPHRDAIEFLLGVLETALSPQERRIRVAALGHFEWCPVKSRAQQRRFVTVLTKLVQSDSWEERMYAIGVCRLWMHAGRVSSLIYDLVLHAETRDMRNGAMSCFVVFKRGEVPRRAISICKRLLKDPDFAGSARAYLMEWGETGGETGRSREKTPN
jgi:hypothetical protein